MILITNTPKHLAIKPVQETQELLSKLSAFKLANTVAYNHKLYISAMVTGTNVAKIDPLSKTAAKIKTLPGKIYTLSSTPKRRKITLGVKRHTEVPEITKEAVETFTDSTKTERQKATSKSHRRAAPKPLVQDPFGD